ncbi:MAG: hypothetical protein JWQ38_2559 [Flavipsychrobacter sp.]|nr:hypothetical protein [Flavipsychrobacter sp.]
MYYLRPVKIMSMRVLCLMFIACLLTSFHAGAQKVAQPRLDKIVRDFAKDGYTLEHTYEPNFNVKNPNTLSRFVPCYTNKSVIIVAVMAFRPADFFFKVMLNGKEAPKTHELENLGTNGEILFYDYRALKFGVRFVSTNQSCMNIMAYDKKATDRPVYTLVFSKVNK